MTKEQIFNKEYARELISIAQQDLASARFLGKAENTRVENVFLLAQQALEKALKAVLCWHQQPIPFVHEIGILVTKLEAKNINPPFGYDLNSLSEYATVRRYMEGRESFTQQEINLILDQVDKALDWCVDTIK